MSSERGGGLRFNDDKLRIDLMPTWALNEVAKVFTYGAKKYASRNWERGMPWSKITASLKRHLAEYDQCKDFDHETGLYHLAHVATNALFGLQYYKIYPQGDDRPRYDQGWKIGLDIDEVVCNWVSGWCTLYNLQTPTSWYFDERLMDKFEAMREVGSLDEFYLNLRPKTAPADIPFEPHCYITARPVSTPVTVEWLKRNGFPLRPVVTVGAGQSKVEAVRESGADIFVDDNYTTFVQLNEAGICTYLFDAPHNQRYNVGARRIKSLKELPMFN